jgi:hypothetical protein
VSNKSLILFDREIVRLKETGSVLVLRPIRPQPPEGCTVGFTCFSGPHKIEYRRYGTTDGSIKEHQSFVKCPFGMTNDILWVRETWAENGSLTVPDRDCVCYRADGKIMEQGWDGKLYDTIPFTLEDLKKSQPNITWIHPWRSSTHMPRWASRFMVKIVGACVLQIKQLQEKNACDSGAVKGEDRSHVFAEHGLKYEPYKTAFSNEWDAHYSKRGFPWKSNPWVWGYTFDLVEEKQ